MLNERRNANVEGGREKATARSGVTRQVVAESRTPETEAELFSAEVDSRRGTEDTVYAGSGFTRKAMAVSTRNVAKGNFPLGGGGRSSESEMQKDR